MNVILETNPLYVSQAGIARYLRGLIAGFAEMPVGSAPQMEQLAWPVTNFGYRQPWRSLRTLYREMVWPHLVGAPRIRQVRPDLVHRSSISLNLPLSFGLPEVVTLYDLAVLRHPERFRRWQLWRETKLLPQLDRASRIICISAFTAREATELLGISPDRMTVVYLANSMIPGQAKPEDIPSHIPTNHPFFLFVGSLEPGKNLRLLQNAYAEAEAAGHPLLPLVVVGARREGVEAEGPPPANWHYAGFLSDGAVQALYEKARALIFPSKYEGFGIPILEAMALGCPVICSPVASIPEVGGTAAHYCDLNSDAYRLAMEHIAEDDAYHSTLVKAGLTWSAHFSWRRCAAETMAVYKSVLS